MPSGWCPQPSPHSRTHRPGRRVAGPNGVEQLRVGVVVVRTQDGYRARSATVQERLLSHVLADRLDRALAEGVSPEASGLLFVRATHLVQPASRIALATGIDHVLRRAAEATPSPLVSRAWVNTAGVLEARFPLQTLVERLAARAPVAARGVAAARLLVTDGAGPLYWPQRNTDLCLSIAKIIAALDPARDWPDPAED
jgi:hypothetical protein